MSLFRFPDEGFLETRFRPWTRWCCCGAAQFLPETTTTSSRIRYSLSINRGTDLFDHYSAKRMRNGDYRSAQLLSNNLALASPGSSEYRQRTSSSSRLSTKLLSKPLAWSIMSAVIFPNAASALYPNVITRALGTSSGRKSLSQKAFVLWFVQVFFGSPFRPWTATIPGRRYE